MRILNLFSGTGSVEKQLSEDEQTGVVFTQAQKLESWHKHLPKSLEKLIRNTILKHIPVMRSRKPDQRWDPSMVST